MRGVIGLTHYVPGLGQERVALPANGEGDRHPIGPRLALAERDIPLGGRRMKSLKGEVMIAKGSELERDITVPPSGMVRPARSAAPRPAGPGHATPDRATPNRTTPSPAQRLASHRGGFLARHWGLYRAGRTCVEFLLEWGSRTARGLATRWLSGWGYWRRRECPTRGAVVKLVRHQTDSGGTTLLRAATAARHIGRCVLAVAAFEL